jgi:hypothetical protein
VEQVEELIWVDQGIIIDSVATALVCSHGLACSIMHACLKFRKCAHGGCPENWRIEKRWTEWECSCNISCSMQMKEKIVTGDESWVHHYQPESKRASMQWKHPSSPSTKKLRHQLGRLCLPCFEILREYYQPIFRSVMKMWILNFTVKFCWSFRMQFTENIQANWLEGYCFIMTARPYYSPSIPEKNSRTTMGTSWIFTLQPGLGP